MSPPHGEPSHHPDNVLLADSRLLVVEIEDDGFLGTADLKDGFLVMRCDHVGRLVLIPVEQVQRVTPAVERPDCLDA